MLMRSLPWMAAGLVCSAIFGSLLFGHDAFDTVMVTVVLFTIVIWVALAISRPDERRWLLPIVVAGFAAKIGGALARYYVVTEVYGTGDAIGYHGFGSIIAHTWRSFEIPSFYGPDARRGAGTIFARYTTSFVYAPHVPTLLGGFITFACIALLGQIAFYVAFRRWFPNPRQRKAYAIMVMFTPTIVFWSASVGKDALMILFLGVAAVGFSWFLATYQVRAALVGLVGFIPAFRLRPHIALMLAGGTLLASLLSRRPVDVRSQARRVVLIGLTLLSLAWAVPQAADALKLDLSSEGLDSFIESQTEDTFRGGSAVEGEPIRNISDIPSGLIRVLFRPLPNEADSLQLQLAAAESVLLVILLAWRFPQMIRSMGRLRRNPWVILCFGYSVIFVVAFSTVLNLGIIARQRVQVLPFFLALVAALGWGGLAEPRSERPRSAHTLEHEASNV